MPANRMKRVVRLEILAGFLLLLMGCALAVMASINGRRAYALVTRSMQTRHAIADLFGELRDAQAGQSTYLLTGVPEFLRPYLLARKKLAGTQSELHGLMATDPVQTHLLNQLDGLISQKMVMLAQAITLHDAGDPSAAVEAVKAGRGLRLMEQIRTLVAEVDDNETHREVAGLRQARRRQQQLLWAIVATTLLALVLAVLVVREEAKQRYEVEFKNAVLKEQMEHQQATEAQLRQAQKMEAVGQLTGGIAHDFNNMLAVVVGNLEMALRRLQKGTDGVENFINNALMGAAKAGDLTKRLLAFSRRQALRPAAIDVNACVQEMFTILSRTLGENIIIQLVLGERLWPAYVDKPQLESAMLNLAVNSRDAMNGQGRLTIETSNAYLDQGYANQHEGLSPGEYVMVSVSDTGQGMTEEVLRKVFEPFFTTKAMGKGTGLGLAQIHGFVTQSKGHVHIHSEVGVGTTVKLYLPRAETVKANTPHAQSTLVATLPHTVLVVEDNAEVRTFVTAAVEDLGYTALQADNAETAENMLVAHPEVSILLTDVVMPGPSGAQLADVMTRRYPGLRVLLMSGYAKDIVERAAPRDSQIRLLAKPFTIQRLAEALRATLNDDA